MSESAWASGALARRRPVVSHAEVPQHAQEPPATSDTPDVDGTLEPFGARPSRRRISGVLALEPRRLHALPREKAVDGLAVNAQDAPNPNGVEPPVMNQPSNRFGMDAELVGNIPNADEAVRLLLRS